MVSKRQQKWNKNYHKVRIYWETHAYSTHAHGVFSHAHGVFRSSEKRRVVFRDEITGEDFFCADNGVRSFNEYDRFQLMSYIAHCFGKVMKSNRGPNIDFSVKLPVEVCEVLKIIARTRIEFGSNDINRLKIIAKHGLLEGARPGTWSTEGLSDAVNKLILEKNLNGKEF